MTQSIQLEKALSNGADGGGISAVLNSHMISLKLTNLWGQKGSCTCIIVVSIEPVGQSVSKKRLRPNRGILLM